MSPGAKPGNRGAGYDGLGHQRRASFSEFLQELRVSCSLSQSGLADEADVDLKAVAYFEAHPAEPLAKRHRREQLGKICRALASWSGKDPGEVIAEINQLGGGVR